MRATFQKAEPQKNPPCSNIHPKVPAADRRPVAGQKSLDADRYWDSLDTSHAELAEIRKKCPPPGLAFLPSSMSIPDVDIGLKQGPLSKAEGILKQPKRS